MLQEAAFACVEVNRIRAARLCEARLRSCLNWWSESVLVPSPCLSAFQTRCRVSDLQYNATLRWRVRYALDNRRHRGSLRFQPACSAKRKGCPLTTEKRHPQGDRATFHRPQYFAGLKQPLSPLFSEPSEILLLPRCDAYRVEGAFSPDALSVAICPFPANRSQCLLLLFSFSASREFSFRLTNHLADR